MEESAGIFARESLYLDRYVQIGVAGNRVINVSFPHERPEDASSDHPVLDAIERYLDGFRVEFDDVELAMTVSTEARAVLETVREIPYGHERDVGSIVAMTPGLSTDESLDIETVRQALRENPVPLLVPDHRVSHAPSGAPAEVEERLRALEGL